MESVKTAITAALLTLSGFTFVFCPQNTGAQQEQKPVPVRTAKVVARNTRITVHTSGIIASKEQMNLSFKIGGIIESIKAEEGDLVEKGTLLATLNQTEIRARVDQAGVEFDKAERNLKNAEKLYADSVMTQERFLDAKSAWINASANLKIARHNLKFASISAPTRGRILRKLGEVNEITEAGRPLFVFSGLTRNFVLRAGVIDRDVIRLSLGDSAAVSFDAYPNRPFSATVGELPAGSNSQTGLYEVELTLSDNGLPLLPGMLGSVEITTQQTQRLSVIPIEALIDANADRGYVYVLDGNVASKRPISLSPDIRNGILVTKGLSPGQIVITEGASYLRDKMRVKIIPSTEHALSD